jgi:Leucine-rich repeat (LRR) protein
MINSEIDLILNVINNKDDNLLNLNNRSLRIIPDLIYKATHLKYLYLDHNKLIIIPNEFGENLRNLEELTLENNELTLLPETFKNLILLKCLNLNMNHLTCLNGSLMENFKQLTHLWLNKCELMQLPNEIGCLVNLKKLGLKSNYLEKLPDEICNLKNLQWLNLESNQLSLLPMFFENLTNLSYLNLNLNKFDNIPCFLFKIKETLNYLLINNNLIRKMQLLDEYIIEFSLLQLVDLRNNPVIDDLKSSSYFDQILLLDNFLFIDKKKHEDGD